MIEKKLEKKKNVVKATFTLPKEAVAEASKVVLVGDFNEWNTESPIALKKQKDGSFRTTLELKPGRSYEFRYLIDDLVWENDWNADDYVPTPFGVFNSVVSVQEVLDQPVKKAPARKAVAKKPASPKTESKKTTKKAVKAEKDDLKRIEGIGPKIAGLLNEAGLNSFAELAKADLKVLKQVLETAGPRFKMHDPATWTEQAKLAAKGEWTKLEKLQAELKGGKRK